MDLEQSHTLNVVLLSVIVIYALHKVIQRGPRKRVLFVIVFFAIISYFSLRSFSAAFSGMTRSPRWINQLGLRVSLVSGALVSGAFGVVSALRIYARYKASRQQSKQPIDACLPSKL